MEDGQAAKEEYTNIVQAKSSALPTIDGIKNVKLNWSWKGKKCERQ